MNPACHHPTDAALAAQLAEEAGELLLAVRDEVGFDYPWLLGDVGDAQANALLLRRLQAKRPADAVLSEEAHDDLSRLGADRVWIIDPLDGTREFSTPGCDDWAVHVALWQRDGGRAARSPTQRSRCRHRRAVPQRHRRLGRRAACRTHSRHRQFQPPPPVLYRLRERLDIQLVRLGSAGAKAMSVVRGDTDAYIHAGGQWEWDSAAPQACCWPRVCTPRGWMAPSWSTTGPTRICLTC
ncbi:3'-phosphoadenosine 5'-phosphate phosphatase [Mycobacterium xenopi 3993]|nr:3'-phosphoadenosine 5'-phosphate phosphatase [Mycobacterium xenopi 3993]